MLIRENKVIFYQFLIALVAGILFIPFLGGVHLFDWDEINFAESAREMIVSRDYLTVQINFKPFWEKPPLFIWMQVLSMKIFGINEFAARFPNAVCGIFTLLFLFNTGRRIYNEKFGLIWVMTYLGSFLPFFYFKTGIIDPWFNLFIFSGIYYIILFTRDTDKKKNRHLVISAVLIGLAILTKGPVAFLIFILTILIYLIFKRSKLSITFINVLAFAVILILVGGFWFILQIISGNFDVIADFINYQIRLFQTKDAGHGGFLLYHFVILLIGVFPASIFALPGFKKHPSDNFYQRDFIKWMIILFWVVLILFTIVKTKIVHYSSLCYFPLTYLAAFTIYKIINKEIEYKKWLNYILVPLGVIYALSIILIPHFDKYKQQLIDTGWIKDEFAIGCMQAEAGWSGIESVISIILISGIIVFLLSCKRKNFQKGILSLFIASALFIYSSILIITPGIEKIAQNAVIEFLKDRHKEDAYFGTIGYKSYAHFYYTKKQVPVNKKSLNTQWLLTGNIDKKAYFSIKIDKKDKILPLYPDLEVLYEKNGFLFCVRNPENINTND
ncbi:MAG: glycosyltransferase family 39 protein [Bacteroidales bacterium]|nr:MAG: glycosyltransferase family 39 protein [Bacteroidales bacterium]